MTLNCNDYFGHVEGDLILKSVGKAIFDSTSRALDVVGRYGGEEFLVALPDTNMDGAYTIAEKIRNNVSDLKIKQNPQSTNEFLSVSLGISSLIPNENLTLEKSIECADMAMNKAKNNGKNKTVMYE